MKQTVYIIVNKDEDKVLQKRNGEYFIDKVSFITEIQFFYTSRIAKDVIKVLYNKDDYKVVKYTLTLTKVNHE